MIPEDEDCLVYFNIPLSLCMTNRTLYNIIFETTVSAHLCQIWLFSYRQSSGLLADHGVEVHFL